MIGVSSADGMQNPCLMKVQFKTFFDLVAGEAGVVLGEAVAGVEAQGGEVIVAPHLLVSRQRNEWIHLKYQGLAWKQTYRSLTQPACLALHS